MKKYRRIAMIMCSVGLMFLLTGVTYSFFNYTKTGNANVFSTGDISFNTDEGESITLTNVFPMSESEASAANLDTLTIGISGSTTYTSGEEFLISIVDVTKVNNKEIPMSYIATYEATTGNSIGIEEADYFTERESKSDNIYLLNENGRVKEDKQVLVGFIKGGTAGIDGTLTIKPYVDAERIIITDTPETIPDLTIGKTVISTTEWNSLKGNNAISFKIKAESNPKLWVEEPEPDNVTPDTCFEKKLVKVYSVNPNMTQTELNDCISYMSNYSYLTFDNNGTAEDFCLGTGKGNGYTFKNALFTSYLVSNEDYLENHNILTSDLGIEIGNYNDSCGTDVVIPKMMNYTRSMVNPNMTQSEINDCVNYFTNTLNRTVNTSLNETMESFCSGDGTMWGYSFQSHLDTEYFSSEELTYLENHNIITVGNQSNYPVLSITYNTFRNTVPLSSLVLNSNLKKISNDAMSFIILSNMNIVIPQSVMYIGSESLIPYSRDNYDTVTVNLNILGKPYIDAFAIRDTFNVSYGGTCQELHDNSAVRYNFNTNSSLSGYIIMGNEDAESYVTTTDTNSCKVYASNSG